MAKIIDIRTLLKDRQEQEENKYCDCNNNCDGSCRPSADDLLNVINNLFLCNCVKQIGFNFWRYETDNILLTATDDRLVNTFGNILLYTKKNDDWILLWSNSFNDQDNILIENESSLKLLCDTYDELVEITIGEGGRNDDD